MADTTIYSSDPLQQPINLGELKTVDYLSLENSGVQASTTKILEFLEELKLGLDQGKEIIRVNIPFLKNESDTRNEYLLYLNPRAADQNNQERILSLANLANILDNIGEWTTKTQFSQKESNTLVERALREIGRPILRSQAEVTETWLSSGQQLRQLKEQIQTLFGLFQELSTEAQPETENLNDFLKLIEESDRGQLLRLWLDPPAEFASVRNLITQFKQLQVGSVILPGKANLPAHQIRLIANAYAQRLAETASYTWPKETPEGVKKDLGLISSGMLAFDVSNALAKKTQLEDDQISLWLNSVDRLVEGLENPETEEKEEVAEDQEPKIPPADEQTTETGAEAEEKPLEEEIEEQPEPEPEIELPESNIPRFEPGNLDPNTPFYTSTKRFNELSVHSGFLLNHITSNIFTLYGLPFETEAERLALPPLIEYQLRQEILLHLYRLDAEQLKSLNRFALGEQLFRQLIVSNPSLFVAIERHIQTRSLELGLQIKQVDPLRLEDRTQKFPNEQFIRSIEQDTTQLTALPEEKLTELKNLAKRSDFNPSFAQSDTQFLASLRRLGIEEPHHENIRRLILAYIQTTGLDLEALVFNRNDAELAAMFDGISIPVAYQEQFRSLVLAYSQTQFQRLQTVSGKRIFPERSMAEMAARQVPPSELIPIIENAHQTARAATNEGRDQRLYILASLSAANDLLPNTTQYRIYEAELKDLYRTQEEVTQAIQTMARIQQQQFEELESSIAHLEYRRFVAVQSLVLEAAAAEEKATELAGAVSIAAYSQLSIQERQKIAHQLLFQTQNQLSPQDVFAQADDYYDYDSGDQSGAVEQVQTQAQTGGATSPIARIRSLGRRLSGPVDLNATTTTATAAKGLSRFRTLGLTSTQRGQFNPVVVTKGGIAARALGGATRAVFGERAGNIVNRAVTTYGVIGAVASGVSAAATFIFTHLPLIGLGTLAAAAVGGLGSLLSSVFGGGSAANVVTASEALAAGTQATPLAGQATTATATATGSAATTAGTSAATATATASPFIPNVATAATGMAIGGTIIATVSLTMTTHSAFLTALPTLGDRYLSPYVEIQKVAVQGNSFDAPTDITYEIQIRARQGYQIKLSEAPTDEFTITFTQRSGEAPRESTKTTPASPEYDQFLAKLTTFHTDNPVITNDFVPVGRYTIPFGSNPGAIDYTDSNVSNVFRIRFAVLDENGQPVPEQLEETIASAGEVICFGECPQAQGGCWPMSGRIGQLPYGQYTHAISALEQDAYDIMAESGTSVYAPFVGELCGSSFSDWRYGVHATLKVDNVTYNGQLGSAYLIFAHLDSLNPQIRNHQCIQVTSEDLRNGGYEIGKSGNTGNSFSPHLHYEARWNTLAVSGKSHPSLIEQLVPTVVAEQDPVRSCYAQ